MMMVMRAAGASLGWTQKWACSDRSRPVKYQSVKSCLCHNIRCARCARTHRLQSVHSLRSCTRSACPSTHLPAHVWHTEAWDMPPSGDNGARLPCPELLPSACRFFCRSRIIREAVGRSHPVKAKVPPEVESNEVREDDQQELQQHIEFRDVDDAVCPGWDELCP